MVQIWIPNTNVLKPFQKTLFIATSYLDLLGNARYLICVFSSVKNEDEEDNAIF